MSPFHQRRTLVAALLSLATHAWASTPQVDIQPGDGININDGRVVVQAVNGEYSQVVGPSTVSYHARTKVQCPGSGLFKKYTKSVAVAFGQENVAGGTREASDNYNVVVAHGHVHDMDWKTVQLNVPFSELQQHPVAACQALMQKKLGEGKNKHQILNSDQIITQSYPMTSVALCGDGSSKNNTWGKDEMNVQLEIVCKAGAVGPMNNQVQAPKGPITAVPMGGNGQVGGGYQPLTITQAQIVTAQKHYSGQCPKNLNFTVRYSGSGKGQLRYSIVEKGMALLKSAPIAYDGKQGWQQHVFNIALDADPQSLNQVVQRDFSLYIELKDDKSNSFVWSDHGAYTGLDWSYTCIPQAAVPMGGQGGKLSQPQGPKPALPIQAAQPETKPGMNLQAQPVKPTPKPLGVQAQPVAPQPAPARAQ